ncbi:MAG: GTP-binding protein [Candidatus Adiutrix sp.]|jgi:small GTP-binding protein|nr:GTP-binding protein [Candidatus Adiutrix sp.]
MLGSFGVGKTALVQQYVNSMFSDVYLSSVGVKISKKTVRTDGTSVDFALWDLEGQDDYGAVNISYLRGAAGFFLVADGVRGETLSVALSLRAKALDTLGADTPHLLLVNKEDLKEKWEITDKVLDSLKAYGVRLLLTSAKTGLNVNEAFTLLAKDMLE